MGIVVQKFGGTSVATAEKLLLAAQRAIDAKLNGNQVAVVVSARGHTTDELIELANEIDPNPPAREMDMLMATGEQVSIALLAMAIHKLGHEAISLTGGQMGIVTDSTHTKARIREIGTNRLRQVMQEGKIAIVAGFQGIDQDWNITTLGRGGSDTTAVAIAAALQADLCEIYTDVDGVYTTDPRVVPTARKIDQISYDEMLELASVGAGVMHSRSIEFAKKYGVVIHVRHAGKREEGTLIRPETPVMEHIVVRGAAIARDEARITLRGVPDVPGIVHRIFSRISANAIVVDMIVQNVATNGRAEVSFTVPSSDLKRTLELANEAGAAIGAARVDSDTDVAKISVVGLGMRTHTGVADRMFGALAARGINILMITTSEIKISVLVEKDRAVEALAAVHAEFELDKPLPEYKEDIRYPLRADASSRSGPAAEERLRSIARNLPAMEDILVSDVDVVENQNRVTLYGVPDRPGVAAKLFTAVAEAGVAVDTIVQSAGTDGNAHISFTCSRSDYSNALRAAERVAQEMGGGEVAGDDRIVKLDVRGVGMRSHTGVATRMFETLASKHVNIQLINTSELHISVMIDRAQSAVANAALREAFHTGNA